MGARHGIPAGYHAPTATCRSSNLLVSSALSTLSAATLTPPPVASLGCSFTAPSGACQRTLRPPRASEAIQVPARGAPPGDMSLATGADDHIVRLFDATTYEVIRTLEGHKRRVTGLHWSNDGKFIASCSSPTVRLWDAATGEQLKSITAHDEYVSIVRWDNQSKRLATGSVDKTAKLWDAATGECLQTLAGHTDEVTGLTWSPDGSRVASTAKDGSIRLWNTGDGECIKTHASPHDGRVFCVTWSTDGKFLATAGDCYVRIWNSETLEEAMEPMSGHWGIINWVDFSPDGSRIASGSKDGNVKLYDGKTGKDIHTIASGLAEVSSVAFSPDGNRIAACGPECVYIYDCSTAEKLGTLSHPPRLSGILGVTWSPESFKLAAPPTPTAEEEPAAAE